MRCAFLVAFLMGILILIAGCTSPQEIAAAGPDNESGVHTIPAGTTVPTVSPPLSVITSSSPTATPQKVTVLSGPLKTIKDPELWFTMQVPESWAVMTKQASNPQGYEGLVYVTYLHDDPIRFNLHDFYITTYAISRDNDQALRTYFRKTWIPVPNESTVTIHGIIFDRFESGNNTHVKVVYVGRKSTANARGFANIIEYSIDSSSQYQQEDFEALILTFHYIAAEDIQDTAGEEIKRPNDIPLFR